MSNRKAMSHKKAGISRAISEAFYPSDWLSEHSITTSSLEVEGAWIRTLCVMWTKRIGSVQDTVEGWSRFWRCSLEDVKRIVAEMQTKNVCVTDTCNGNVTLTCRRLKRRELNRLQTRERVRNARCNAQCNANVTQKYVTETHQNDAPPDALVTQNQADRKPTTGKTLQTANKPCNAPVTPMYTAPSSSSSSSSSYPESTKRTDIVQTDVNNIALDCPPELASLELYAKDQKLIQRWPQCYRAWKEAYPSLDIMSQVKKAHSWEVDNPARRKKHRPRFLGRWLARAQDNHKVSRDDNLDRDAFGVIPMPSQAEIDAISAMEARIAAKEAAQKAAQQ